MLKTKVLLCLCMQLISFSLFAGGQNENPTLDYTVPVTDNWVFYSPNQPVIRVVVKNNTSTESISRQLMLNVKTDKHVPVTSLGQTVTCAKGDSIQIDFTFSVPEPGFYRCHLVEADGNVNRDIKKFNVGYEPTAIVSLPDPQPDFKEFWDAAKQELAAVAPEYQMTLIADSSNKVRKLYMVTMKSLGGETISGYYSTPTTKGKYPVVISYMGYGSKPWVPGGNAEFAEFVLSVRGQALLEETNRFGDWITYRLDSKEDYYYRGAFMDLIRAIDFVSSRPEINTKCIFAEGGSQGGAFTMAACALDNRIRAAAPYIPFLSDYPDYFQIVNWPADPVRKAQQSLGLSDAQLYTLLSYFDIKNLAEWIECPIIMSVGLQDEVCPPHTNFAGFNRICSEKKYYIYPEIGHDAPSTWWETRMNFFRRYM